MRPGTRLLQDNTGPRLVKTVVRSGRVVFLQGVRESLVYPQLPTTLVSHRRPALSGIALPWVGIRYDMVRTITELRNAEGEASFPKRINEAWSGR